MRASAPDEMKVPSYVVISKFLSIQKTQFLPEVVLALEALAPFLPAESASPPPASFLTTTTARALPPPAAVFLPEPVLATEKSRQCNL